MHKNDNFLKDLSTEHVAKDNLTMHIVAKHFTR